MIVDLTDKIGMPVKFDTETLEIQYGDSIVPEKKYSEVGLPNDWKKDFFRNTMSGADLWQSLKLANDFRRLGIKDVNQEVLSRFWPPGKPLYLGRQGFWDDQTVSLQELIDKYNLRPDLTILPSGTLGDEYLRTEGHHHKSGFPEVYETIFGNNIYLLFKTDDVDPAVDSSEKIKSVKAVFAEPGDHVLFPPGYQHVTINVGEIPFVMTDWVSSKASSNFEYIKAHHGCPFWVVKTNNGPVFRLNPAYTPANVPDVELVEPVREISEFGFVKDQPMMSIVHRGEISKLEFLNAKVGNEKVFNSAFTPLSKSKFSRMFPDATFPPRIERTSEG